VVRFAAETRLAVARCVFVAVAGLLPIERSGAQESQAVPPPASVESKPASDPTLADLQRRIERLERDEAGARDQISGILAHVSEHLDFISVYGTIAAVLAGILGFMGAVEIYRSRALRQQADDLIKTAKDGATHVEQLRASLVNAWGKLDIRSLPDVYAKSYIARVHHPSFAAEQRALWRDIDTVLSVADRLGIEVDKATSSENFTKLCRFWRLAEQYERAILRGRRAVELDPKNDRAHWQLSYALSYYCNASRESLDQTRRDAMLEEAIFFGRRAHSLQTTAQALDAIGWALDEQGLHRRASEFFARARDLEATRAKKEGGTPDETYGYNLACSLCRAGDLNEALAALRSVLGSETDLDAVSKDPDLAALKESAEHRQIFSALLADTRSRLTRPPQEVPQTATRRGLVEWIRDRWKRGGVR